MDQDVNNNGPLLRLLNVCRNFSADVAVLRGISLDLAGGESLAIVGPSGCGKSTLLNIIGALDRADGGQVLFDGKDLNAMTEEQLAHLRNREVGFVFQDHHLLPQLSAMENVLIPTLPTGTRNADRERAKALFEQVGLSDRAKHRPAQLSGGERQRVAVVRALINEPKLLLADEPTGSLDEKSADALGDLLTALNREHNVSMIVVTHASSLAEKMQRTSRLHEGTLENAGATA